MGNQAYAYLSAGVGAGLAVIGAGMGIGQLSASAMEGIGRQPAAAGDIRTLTLIVAGLIEGIALFGVVVCLLLALKV